MKLFRNAVERPRHKAGPARREGPVTALPARLAPSVLPSGLQGSENIIDMDHLARMTLGDASLTVDILRLFDRQAAMLLARMMDEVPKVIAALAHTLNGSARGIGAWQVGAAAESLERTANDCDPADLESDLGRLADAVAEAQIVIADLTRAR